MILTVVAGAVRFDMAERLHPLAQERLAGMVFVADDLAEVVGRFGQIADHTHFPTDRIGANHADAVQPGAVDRLEIFAEQLVQAADHEHRHTVGRK